MGHVCEMQTSHVSHAFKIMEKCMCAHRHWLPCGILCVLLCVSPLKRCTVINSCSYTQVIAIIALTNNPTCSPIFFLTSILPTLRNLPGSSHAFSQYYSLVLALVSQARLHFSGYFSLSWCMHEPRDGILFNLYICSSILETL